MLVGHFLSHNLMPEVSLGHFLATFMETFLPDTVLKGFSHFEEEACHEAVHGPGTCDFFAHRDGLCLASTTGYNLA